MTTDQKPTMGAEEFSESLNGYEELGIAKHWDLDIYSEAETRPVVALRALVFTHRTRLGDNAVEAKKFAMELAVKEAMAYFPDPDEADDEADPAGNGEGR